MENKTIINQNQKLPIFAKSLNGKLIVKTGIKAGAQESQAK